MQTHLLLISRRLFIVLLACAAAAAGGCGNGNPGSQLLEEAERVYLTQQAGTDPTAGANMDRDFHAAIARQLDRVLDQHPDAPEPMRRALQTIRDGEQRLADGASGAEAADLRDRHEEYWSYLREGQLPPDYR